MANTYLTRTPSSATNRKTFTISTWVKRGTIGSSNQYIINAYSDANNFGALYFDVSDVLVAKLKISSSVNTSLVTNRVFRDTSAWYHVVWKVDTTQSTESDRSKLYINGVEETSFGGATYLSQNTDTAFNNTVQHTIGAITTSNYFDGSMSHIHLIDGTAYDASAFGETDANGVWKIKTSPSVTYGTNGFFILKDGNSVTDQSGNGNNFTVAGGTLTNTEDSPSNVFATMNPLINRIDAGTSYPATFSNGNNRVTFSDTNSFQSGVGTLGFSSGKWYWEAKVNVIGSDSNYLGILVSDYEQTWYGTTNAPAYTYKTNGQKQGPDSTSAAFGNSYTTNDIIQIAVDMDNSYIYFGKNGTWQNSGDPTSGASGTGAAFNFTSGRVYMPHTYGYLGADVSTNFGNGYFGTTAVASAGTNASGIGIFEYDVPTGYTALSTKGLNL
jgi:hypothetical protein